MFLCQSVLLQRFHCSGQSWCTYLSIIWRFHSSEIVAWECLGLLTSIGAIGAGWTYSIYTLEMNKPMHTVCAWWMKITFLENAWFHVHSLDLYMSYMYLCSLIVQCLHLEKQCSNVGTHLTQIACKQRVNEEFDEMESKVCCLPCLTGAVSSADGTIFPLYSNPRMMRWVNKALTWPYSVLLPLPHWTCC